MADLNKIVDELSKLTVLEAAKLSKMLEEKWGVSAAAPVAVVLAAAAAVSVSPINQPASIVIPPTLYAPVPHV